MTDVLLRHQIIEVLKQRGFALQGPPRKYAESWKLIGNPQLFNLKTHDSKPLVIAPNNENRLSELQGINGVIIGERPYCHNTSFKGFPKRSHGGVAPINHGIDFGFESTRALNSFLDILLGASAQMEMPTADEDIDRAENLPDEETERRAVIAARRGQGRFRDDLVRAWGSCAVTGCVNPAMLRASHIKPWRISNNSERLSPDNGLLLSAHLDAAFDRGLISFSDDGAILIDTHRLNAADAKALGIHSDMRLTTVRLGHLPHLASHRSLNGFSLRQHI